MGLLTVGERVEVVVTGVGPHRSLGRWPECRRRGAGPGAVRQLALASSLLTPWLAACSHGASAGATAAAPSRPSPRLRVPASLEFYVGTWRCDATVFDAHGAPVAHLPLEIRVAPQVDNWLSVDVYQDGKRATAELKGVDPDGTFRHLWAAAGGPVGTLTSPLGWQDGRMVFEEDHPAPSSRSRMTFTKVDDTHYRHRAEVDAGDGFQLQFEKTCHKA